MIYTAKYSTNRTAQVESNIRKALQEVEEGKSVYLIVGDRRTISTILPTTDPRWSKLAELLYKDGEAIIAKRHLYLCVKGKECNPKKGDIVIDLYTMLTYNSPGLCNDADLVILPWIKDDAEKLQRLCPLFIEDSNV